MRGRRGSKGGRRTNEGAWGREEGKRALLLVKRAKLRREESAYCLICG
jgi:hypothetical protein